MFLLLVKSRHLNGAQVYDLLDEAIAAARQWVGAHNPADGCSCEPVERAHANTFRVRRTSSWGERSATVNVVKTTELLEIALP